MIVSYINWLEISRNEWLFVYKSSIFQFWYYISMTFAFFIFLIFFKLDTSYKCLESI